MPVEFVEYIKYVRELKFEEKPDYNYIQGLFISVLSKNELRNDLMFSWIINKRNICDIKTFISCYGWIQTFDKIYFSFIIFGLAKIILFN